MGLDSLPAADAMRCLLILLCPAVCCLLVWLCVGCCVRLSTESMLALWKLHQHYDLGLAASSTSSDNSKGSANTSTSSSLSSTKYLQLLARTAEFVRDHVTDNEGGGEQFWQVRGLVLGA